MMSASGLKNAVQSKFIPPPTDADTANSLFGDAVKEYLSSNCDVTYTWAGVSGGGSPDPITLFKAHPLWTSFNLSKQPNIAAWSINMTSEIVLSLIIPEDITFVLTNMVFGNILITISQSGKTDQNEAILSVCEEIINGVKGMVNPLPSTGTHGIYSGSAQMMEIK